MRTSLVVLGGGPGGYAAAFLAADQGHDVVLVEADPRLGGTCLLRGCIPSKALLHLARVMGEVDQLSEEWGVHYGPPRIELDQVRDHQQALIERLSGGLQQLAKRRQVKVIHARGHFRDSHTLELHGEHESLGEDRELSFDHCILATGSRPVCPPGLASDSERVMDSGTALDLQEIPSRLLVIGGGYIGLELGTVYARLGSRVSVAELTPGLLPGVDRDLVKVLQRRLDSLFAEPVMLDTRVDSIQEVEAELEISLTGPEGTFQQSYDRVLVAVGRAPASMELGLENTQVSLDGRGFVICDQQQRTADPAILAVGDVCGEPMLAHHASFQAKTAIRTLQGKSAERSPELVPAIIFTDPEIAWVGLTQTQARERQQKVRPAIYPWAASGRAQALGRTDGMTRWLVDPETDALLGCGIVGAGAGDLIAEAVLAIERGCRVQDVAEVIHPHPTLSETLSGAAEVYLGTATEVYKPRR
ncbi:MAG: dihydrolipoyl dehydrogenase [Pirellulaceae bacterium]